MTSPATPQANRAIALELWRATSESDAHTIRGLLAADVVWRTVGRGDLSGEVRGRDGVIDQLARTGEMVDALTSELIDVFASDNGAITYYRVQAERGTSSIESTVLLMLEIERGLVVGALSVPAGSEDEKFWRSA